MNVKKKKKINKRNSKILHDTVVTLGALKEAENLQELPINEIQVHLLDDSGDGVILCLGYDELTGELKKTFSSVDEYYEEVDEELTGDTPHYYGEQFEGELDPCISPENIKEFLKAKIEETISEEYDEIFLDNDDGKPPLLN